MLSEGRKRVVQRERKIGGGLFGNLNVMNDGAPFAPNSMGSFCKFYHFASDTCRHDGVGAGTGKRCHSLKRVSPK